VLFRSGVDDDPDHLEEEDLYDPNFVLEEFLTENDRHVHRFTAYLNEKAMLIETNDVKESAHGNVVWTVRDDIRSSDVPTDQKAVGVRGFDLNNTTVKNGSRKGKKRINLLLLLIHLWPGDWKCQLKRLNRRIRRQNDNLRAANATKINQISQKEFWVFWASLLVSYLEGKKGKL
jgi:hypothetical protein